MAFHREHQRVAHIGTRFRLRMVLRTLRRNAHHGVQAMAIPQLRGQLAAEVASTANSWMGSWMRSWNHLEPSETAQLILS